MEPIEVLDCGHIPDKGHPANVGGKIVVGWTFVVRDGKKICHACDNKRILDCGHNPSPHEYFTSGTAHTPDGREICGTCADKEQIAELLTKDHASGYLSRDMERITTWTGGVLGKVLDRRKRKNNFAGYIFHLQVKDVHGQIWYGSSPGPSMYCRLHKTAESKRKAQARKGE